MFLNVKIERISHCWRICALSPTVKAAVEALQNADKAAWNLLFTPKAVLDDDGSSGDLKRFAQELFGCDSFICIDRIANNGLYIEGDFHSEEWGNFRRYFNLALSGGGRKRDGRSRPDKTLLMEEIRS
jgi:hypothetical protein